MNPIEVYIKKGYEVMNALIENADITTEDYPTVNIQLKLPCGGVVFGGYSFAHVAKGDFKLEGWEKGMTAIFRIMEVADIKKDAFDKLTEEKKAKVKKGGKK